ncbi:MAG: biotin carboxylase N-terminal domain-containing protein, partial [Myxococcota bacterium]
MKRASLLIANRGEVAIRVARAAAERGLRSVGVFSKDDAASLHTRMTDESRELSGSGPAAYLDGQQIIAVAAEAGCDAIHPGYGFLSESAAFAGLVADAGLRFVGPTAATLALLGDKTRARALAGQCGVPLLRGSEAPASLEDARAFFASLGADRWMAVKAVTGGGGRGLRAVRRLEDLEEAYSRCRSEAAAAFGNDAVTVEEWVPRARHIEVQIVGDGAGGVLALGERECSLQRRNQKLVEVAPSPGLSPDLRAQLIAAAIAMATRVDYRSLGTFEFLVLVPAPADGPGWAFLEANPRLQVEHTVTEAVTGVDLVQTQLAISAGHSLADLGLDPARPPEPRGFAVEARINMETIAPDGTPGPEGGSLHRFELPSGPGLRVDSFGYAGYTPSPRFDSLLAKLIGHVPTGGYADAIDKVYRALCELRIDGVRTNLPFLQNLLRHPDVRADRITTRFVDERLAELASNETASHRRLFFDLPDASLPSPSGTATAGARIDSRDPLAVLDHGRSRPSAERSAAVPGRAAAPVAGRPGPEGTLAVRAPMQGTVLTIRVREGDVVHRGEPLLVMEAMKMEHVIAASVSGIVRRIDAAEGDALFEGTALAYIEAADVGDPTSERTAPLDRDHVRPDLAQAQARHAKGLDASRPDAVAR